MDTRRKVLGKSLPDLSNSNTPKILTVLPGKSRYRCTMGISRDHLHSLQTIPQRPTSLPTVNHEVLNNLDKQSPVKHVDTVYQYTDNCSLNTQSDNESRPVQPLPSRTSSPTSSVDEQEFTGEKSEIAPYHTSYINTVMKSEIVPTGSVDRQYVKCKINVEGGQIEVSGSISVSIPAHSFTKECEDFLLLCKSTNAFDQPPLSSGQNLISDVYHLLPHATYFNKPLMVTLYFKKSVASRNIILLYSPTDIEETPQWQQIYQTSKFSHGSKTPCFLVITQNMCTVLMQRFCVIAAVEEDRQFGGVHADLPISTARDNYRNADTDLDVTLLIFGRCIPCGENEKLLCLNIVLVTETCSSSLRRLVGEMERFGQYIDEKQLTLNLDKGNLHIYPERLAYGWQRCPHQRERQTINVNDISKQRNPKVSFHLMSNNPNPRSMLYAEFGISQEHSKTHSMEVCTSTACLCNEKVGSPVVRDTTSQEPTYDIIYADLPLRRHTLPVSSTMAVEQQPNQEISDVNVAKLMPYQMRTPSLDYATVKSIAREMDISHPEGKDWRALACYLGIKEIDNIEYMTAHHQKSPTEYVLRVWDMNTNGDMEALRKAFVESGREYVTRHLDEQFV